MSAAALFNDSFPTNHPLKYTDASNAELNLDLNKELPNKRVIFTSTGSANELPKYFDRLHDLKNKGVDKVVILNNNTPQDNYAALQGTGFDDGFVVFATDEDAALSCDLGENYVEQRPTGRRNSAYTAIVENGKLTYLSNGHDDNIHLLLRLDHAYL